MLLFTNYSTINYFSAKVYAYPMLSLYFLLFPYH